MEEDDSKKEKNELVKGQGTYLAMIKLFIKGVKIIILVYNIDKNIFVKFWIFFIMQLIHYVKIILFI